MPLLQQQQPAAISVAVVTNAVDDNACLFACLAGEDRNCIADVIVIVAVVVVVVIIISVNSRPGPEVS